MNLRPFITAMTAMLVSVIFAACATPDPVIREIPVEVTRTVPVEVTRVVPVVETK